MSSNTNIKPSDIALLDILKLLRGSTEYETRIQNLIDTVGTYVHPTFVNIEGSPTTNVALNEILTEMSSLIALNSANIFQINRLLTKLLFELIQQGVKIEDKELIEELETYGSTR